jgi:hypothetical protein
MLSQAIARSRTAFSGLNGSPWRTGVDDPPQVPHEHERERGQRGDEHHHDEDRPDDVTGRRGLRDRAELGGDFVLVEEHGRHREQHHHADEDREPEQEGEDGAGDAEQRILAQAGHGGGSLLHLVRPARRRRARRRSGRGGGHRDRGQPQRGCDGGGEEGGERAVGSLVHHRSPMRLVSTFNKPDPRYRQSIISKFDT